MRNKTEPGISDGVNSLDRGLRLLQVLRDFGTLRVTDAAEQLGVSRSTAHRLLSTLIARGFATQDEWRVYRPGPAMDAGPARLEWTRDFRLLAQPHLELLARRSGESANLMIRLGLHVRFLVTIRAESLHATSDREGTVMLAHQASGGKALLARLSPDQVSLLYASKDSMRLSRLDRPGVVALLSELEKTRSRDFAINFEETEKNVAAVGVAVLDRQGEAIGALSVSTPADRFTESRQRTLVALIDETKQQIERDLAEHPLGRRFQR
jgi:IclR family acetate operon transcriptional repressor